MHIAPRTKRQVKKIIPYVIIWFTAGILYTILEKGLLGDSNIYPSTGNVYSFKSSLISVAVGTLIMGVVFGVLEISLGKRLFKSKPFGIKIFLKTILYVLMICGFLITLSIISNGMRTGLGVFHPEVIESVNLFIVDLVFWSVVLYVGVFISFALFTAEMIDNLGVQAISNFFLGRYQTPKIEERIFMFLDMRSSTTIAEQLGHVMYYQFLNTYYEDMTDAIIDTEAEIYQYVGDEIVLSWSLKEGLKLKNCIRCFFMIKERIASKSYKYMKDYDVIPEFKAGLHSGDVTTGEIGVIKKDILFTGDVLNTAARIQSMCNKLDSECLISEDLARKINFDDGFAINDMGQFELRGKGQKVKLYSVVATS
ncbi:MAG: adenylate/guanylate cyclase domain-containing protein, partial [Bacteroidota bacterium]